MQLVVATSRSPGCGQRTDDLGMLICGWPMFAAGKRSEIIGASAVLQQLRQLGDVDGDAPKRARAHVCAQESSHRPRANQGGWLGASSKVMVFVGAPLASLAGTMSTR